MVKNHQFFIKIYFDKYLELEIKKCLQKFEQKYADNTNIELCKQNRIKLDSLRQHQETFSKFDKEINYIKATSKLDEATNLFYLKPSKLSI